MPPVSVFIYGSCVSRDAFNFAESGSFTLVDYYARSSLVSALAPSLPSTFPLEKIKSNFKRRVVERDIAKTLLRDLVKNQYDILLIDFIDERLHIMEIKNQEKKSYLTMSTEFREMQTSIAVKHVIRGFSKEKNDLWVFNWKKFVDFCVKHNIYKKIYINKFFFAKRNNIGTPVAQYTSEQIDEANASLDFMYRRAAQDIPSRQFLDYDTRLFVANKEHRWGETPFHYIDAIYRATLAQLGIPPAKHPVTNGFSL